MDLYTGVSVKVIIKVTDKEIIKGYVDNIRTKTATESEKIKVITGFMNQGNFPLFILFLAWFFALI